MKRVYIAGQISLGDTILNVRNAILAADRVLNAGYAPYLPHLNILWHMVSPHELEDWLGLDITWLAQCDALILLPGESKGADIEVSWAKENGIPVYHGVEEFIEAVRGEDHA